MKGLLIGLILILFAGIVSAAPCQGNLLDCGAITDGDTCQKKNGCIPAADPNFEYCQYNRCDALGFSQPASPTTCNAHICDKDKCMQCHYVDIFGGGLP